MPPLKTKRKRCPNGTRKNKKTGECVRKIKIENKKSSSSKPKKMSIHTLDELFNAIFRRLEEKEKKLPVNDRYRYVTHDEFDDINATYYEEMANARLIGLCTRLEEPDINIAMNLLQPIVDGNYWLFEDFEIFDMLPTNTYTKEQIENMKEKMKKWDIDIWMEVLMKYENTFTIDTKQPKPIRRNLLKTRTGKLAHPELGKMKPMYFELSDLPDKLPHRPASSS